MPGPFLKFDSRSVGAGDAEEIWRESLRPLYEVWRCREARFRAKIEVWDLGSMLMTRHFAFDDVQFRRTRGKIASTPAEQCLVHCLLGGELASEFDGGQQRVPVGSVALRDLAIENVGFARSAPMLTLSVPRASLERRLPLGAPLHAVGWEANDPIGGMVTAHIQSLGRLVNRMTQEQARLAGEATLSLLASCLLPKAKPGARRGDPRLAPMLRAQALSHIERNLSDPGLDAAAVAAAVGISRTALYELFAASGGVARHVRARRLDEAMRRLRMPGVPRERVAEIAYGLGFSAESVFSRAFKERFGCAPSEAREAAEAPVARSSGGTQSIGAAYEAKVQSLPV
ncbi:helix-turn-helix domain-containing protein [Paraburkholderia sp. Ac-20336]|uniref:helix-turn-helix domain-containing protein n=1 Tax=unclassified Paraburkholderia TaxID=2615204 RepID=UPI00141E173B|nr:MULTISPECIES: helix-turn-helix domain-containing protein [unclassified Paraburkholderia]MBN3806458.1 helix-turn-helix domain-containing protein [Paraburkholderia sp. Ac-20336]NIF80730.1 helix-turn-helix domain-containing protein [Paraburkholderia sp. Cy-641]